MNRLCWDRSTFYTSAAIIDARVEVPRPSQCMLKIKVGSCYVLYSSDRRGEWDEGREGKVEFV